MFGLGMPELIIIMVIALMVFGAGRLSEIGGAIGKGIRSFKRSVNEPDTSIAEKSGTQGEKAS